MLMTGVDSPLHHKVSVAKAEAVFALHIRARACRRHSEAAIGVETRGIWLATHKAYKEIYEWKSTTVRY